jgi:hypothetical protein
MLRKSSIKEEKTSVTRQHLSKHVLAATDEHNNRENAGGSVLCVVHADVEGLRSWKKMNYSR